MTEHNEAVTDGLHAVAVGEVIPPAGRGTKAGSTEALKALHADLTAAYQHYLEMAKIKPSMLNPAMLGLIQQFLKHNEITAEVPQKDEVASMQARLEHRRKLREIGPTSQGRVNLSQAKRA